MPKSYAIVFGWLMMILPAVAQVDPAAFRTDILTSSARAHFSSSRQFIVHDALETGQTPLKLDETAPGQAVHPGPGMALSLEEILGARPGSRYVRLDASALTMSCERIKQAMLAELGLRDGWKGKIYLDLHHARSPGESILVMPQVYFGSWDYRAAVPDVLERPRVVSAIVELLLLEMANRDSERSAEIPAWLTQGLAQELMLSSDVELVLDRPNQSVSSANMIQVNSRLDVEWRRGDPLQVARQELHDAPPLTLEQLSWPKSEQLEGKTGETYRGSAQLFVHELLQFNDGRQCMTALIHELPRHLNWQLSFRDAFHSHFATQLDLEKWWALKLVEFTGRDLSQSWPSDESWRKLDEIIHPVADVRTGAKDLPTRTKVSFQAIIREWDFVRQNGVLRERAQQLGLLRARVSQDLIYLVDDYRRVLEGYLEKKTSVGFDLTGRKATFGRDKNTQATLRDLDVLDMRMEQARPRQETAKADVGNTSVTH